MLCVGQRNKPQLDKTREDIKLPLDPKESKCRRIACLCRSLFLPASNLLL